MSTKIFASANTSVVLANVCYGKRFVVNSEQEKLSDYVRRVINEKGLSYRSVTHNSGGRISPTTISDIINEQIGDIKTQTLKALAKGLQVDEDEVVAIAMGNSMAGDLTLAESRMLHFYRHIPMERQTDALSYLEMLFNRYGTEPSDQKNGKGPRPGAVYEAVAGIPKSVRGGRKKASKSPRKKSDK